MNDFLCFGISTVWWDCLLTMIVILVLPWKLYKFFPLFFLLFLFLAIPVGRIVHQNRMDLTRFHRIEEGLSRKIGKGIVLDRVIGGDEDSTLTAFARTGDAFMEFPIKVVRIHMRDEYVVYTTPAKVMPFKWCVQKGVDSREEFIKVIRKNESHMGDIACDRLRSYDKDILSITVVPGCTVVAFQSGFHPFVAMLSDEDAGRLIESARKKEFDWQYVLSRFLSLEPA